MRIEHRARASVLGLCGVGVLLMAAHALAEPRGAAGGPAVVGVADASNRCLQVGLTSRSGNTISGHGSVSCDHNSADIELQRSRWYGWETVKHAVINGPGGDVYVSYDCGGTGTHDFRTRVSGTTIGGSFEQKISNVITASCGG